MISFGTPTFQTNVLVFENTLLNVREGAKLYDLVQEKKRKIERDIDIKLNLWINNHSEEAQHPSFVRDHHDELKYGGFIQLYHFMIQLLEDKGFGFYKSNIPSDDKGLDG